MTYFDHFANSPMTPVGRWMVSSVVQREYQFIRRHLSDTRAAVLEIGAGRGEFAQLMRRNGFANYTAVEPNPSMRRELIGLGFPTKDYLVPQLQEDDASYDAIILNDVFEHLNDTAEAKTFVAESRRVLRPGGLLCISCPDYTHWGVDFFNSDFSHANITTVRRTVQLFMNYGLRPLGHIYLSGPVTGAAATLLSYVSRFGFFFVRSPENEQKLYKLKLSLLRRFLIVGQK